MLSLSKDKKGRTLLPVTGTPQGMARQGNNCFLQQTQTRAGCQKYSSLYQLLLLLWNQELSKTYSFTRVGWKWNIIYLELFSEWLIMMNHKKIGSFINLIKSNQISITLKNISLQSPDRSCYLSFRTPGAIPRYQQVHKVLFVFCL